VAAVAIHAELPPFASPGQTIDITVSSIGNAKSLRGGSLLMTPLKGIDGQVYAIAQGNLVVGGFGAEGADGSRITVNVPSVGRIPNGATVERAVANPFASGDHLEFNLNRPDFTTAKRVVDQINSTFGPDVAQALNAGSIRVRAPLDANQPVDYLSMVENLQIEHGTAAARAVTGSRTGPIVRGQGVRLEPAGGTPGGLTVTSSENYQVGPPEPLRGGRTVVTPSSQVSIEEGGGRMFVSNPGVSLDEIVRAVNQVG